MRRPDQQFIAAYQLIAGLYSLATALDRLTAARPSNGASDTSSVILLAAASAVSVTLGAMLWRDTPNAAYWSRAFQALQVPHAVLSVFAYALTVGGEVTLALKDGGWVGFGLSFGYRAALSFGHAPRALDVGLNLWPLWLCVHLTLLDRPKRTRAVTEHSDLAAQPAPAAVGRLQQVLAGECN